MRQRHRNNIMRRTDGGGFTLIELMVVLTIIAILITFLIPVLYEAIAQARFTKWMGLRRNLQTRTSCRLLFTFHESEIWEYDEDEIDDSVDDVVTGRLYNASKAEDPKSAVNLNLTAPTPDYGELINGPLYMRTTAEGEQVGRFKYKGAMIFNEDDATGVQTVAFDEAYPSIFKTFAEEFTVYAWIYPTALSGSATNHGGHNIFMAHGSDSNNDNFEVGVNPNGSVEVYIHAVKADGKGDKWQVDAIPGSSGQITTDAWHFVCVRYNHGLVDVWVNDQRFSSDFVDRGDRKLQFAANSPITIGATYHGSDNGKGPENGFIGRIGEVVGFNEAVSEGDVMVFYQHGLQ